MLLKGLFTFPYELLCKEEVLGQCFIGKISNIDVKIIFPGCPSKEKGEILDCVGHKNPLLSPEGFKDYKRGNKEITWGYPMQYPEMNSFVESVLIELECDDADFEQTAQALYNDIQRWNNSFINYYQLCTKQFLNEPRTVHHCSDLLAVFSPTEYVQSCQPHIFEVDFHSNFDYISKKDLEEAIRFASSGKELLLEYQMLLSAYEARKDKHNRQAVIDACSAAELTLNKAIEDFSYQKNFDSTLLTTKYRYLGDKFNLVSKIDVDFPKLNFKKDIVDLRNAVAHNKKTLPFDEETDTLISCVEELLKYYHTSFY